MCRRDFNRRQTTPKNPKIQLSPKLWAKQPHLALKLKRLTSQQSPMFEALADRLESTWKKLRGQNKISESNIQDAIKEVRRALLEADVNLQVVKNFVGEVTAKAQGAEVVSGVRPDQQFIKIVHDELVRVMGETNVPLATAESGPTVILMAGLQGTGKTTATAKLALHLRKQNRTALLVATDIYRPAAIDQLLTLGKQIDVPVFELGTDTDPCLLYTSDAADE